MNIFEALSQGKGSINEENTSSFLAYLLKPSSYLAKVSGFPSCNIFIYYNILFFNLKK